MDRKQTEILVKMAVFLGFPLLMFMIPPPEGLTVLGWKMAALFVTAILGLVLKPFPIPIMVLAVIVLSSIFLGNIKDVLRGYSSTTLWTIFAALSLSTAITTTGLGKRIAFHLIRRMGGTTLGLGYVLAFLDLIVSPCTPSVVARSGSIVYTVAESISRALDSTPGDSARKIGSFLMMNAYLNTKSTAYIFLTACTPNLLVLPFMQSILKLEVTWMTWFYAASLPGIVTLLLTPLVIYIVYPPELKRVNKKEIAEAGLAELGPMTWREKVLVVIFCSALAGWIIGSFFKVDAAVVAMTAMAATILTGVMSWDDLRKSKGAWDILIWFGGVLGLADALSKAGFFVWLGKFIAGHLGFVGDNATVALIVIILLSVIIRYFIVSGSAYAVAMIPVFFTVGTALGVSPGALGYSLAFSAVYGSGLTHYGSAPGPIIFGANYVSLKEWWSVGAVVVAMIFLVQITLGFTWWKYLGLY